MTNNVGNIKTDPFTQRVETTIRWAVGHWQQVALGAGALAVAGALTLVVVSNLRKLRLQAWEQLSSAQTLAAQGKRDQALQAVSQLLSGNRSGALVCQANLFKGDVLLTDNHFPEAVQAYQEALRQAATPELKALALSGLALALEQSQKWKEAEDAYRRFVAEFPEHFLAARCYESLGRVLLYQQKWADAESAFEKLVTLYPTTIWAKNAQEYLTQIKYQTQKH